MKTILLNSLACAALLFVTACGHDEPAPVTTSSTTTTESQQVPAMVPAPATTTTETQQVHSY